MKIITWRPQSQSTALNPSEDSIEQLVILSFILTLNISEMFPLSGNLFDLPDVKLGLTLKASMLVETIEMYNPDYYPFEMLAKNKEIWIGKVEAKFYDLVEFANSLRSNEGLTEEDERRLNDCVKKSRDQFKKYNFDLNRKTCLAISTKAGVDALVVRIRKLFLMSKILFKQKLSSLRIRKRVHRAMSNCWRFLV